MFKVELRNKFVRFLVFAILIILSLLPTIMGKDQVMTTMEHNKPYLEEVIPVGPVFKFFSPMLDIMNDTLDLIRSGDDGGYLWLQWFSKNLLQFLGLAVILMAAVEFNRDFETKTVYFDLNFVKRENYFNSKVLSTYFYIFVIILIQAVVMILLAPYFGIDIANWQVILASLQIFLSLIVLYHLVLGLVILLSRKRGTAYLIAIFVFVIFLFMPIFQSGVINFPSARNVLVDAQPTLPGYIITVAVSGLLYLGEYGLFRSMDL